MPLDRKILYSLFGAPLRQDIGTTIDGHRAYDQINPANPTLSLSFERLIQFSGLTLLYSLHTDVQRVSLCSLHVVLPVSPLSRAPAIPFLYRGTQARHSTPTAQHPNCRPRIEHVKPPRREEIAYLVDPPLFAWALY